MTRRLRTPARSERRADPAARRRGRIAARFLLLLAPAMIGANSLGGAVVYVYLAFLSPSRPEADDATGTVVNTVVFLGYLGGGILVGTLASALVLLRMRRWLRTGEDASPEDRHATLRLPARLVRVYAAIWGGAVLVFLGLNLNDSLGQALTIALTVLVGGMTTCAVSYLLAERLVRPVVTEAMAGLQTPPEVVLGVRRRVLLAWALGSAVPLGGIFVGALDLNRSGMLDQRALLFLSGVGLLSGLLASLFTARSIADPVESVTSALRQVAAGRFDVQVPVYDGSEVGQLQSGLNSMVSGLRERERLRDLFGRQVGTDVARLSLEEGVRLGGEVREVAVLFVDVVGSTALAVRSEPAEVVRQLNAFFTVVVEAVAAHGGWVNKFEGDAALCVFGAPERQADAPGCALAAARALAEGLRPLPLEAAIGVGAGPVVAGHVGTEARFEYTVIGDPVNTAARLSELARNVPGRALADAALLTEAGQEADRWVSHGEAVLRGRGRDRPTRLAVPRGAA